MAHASSGTDWNGASIYPGMLARYAYTSLAEGTVAKRGTAPPWKRTNLVKSRARNPTANPQLSRNQKSLSEIAVLITMSARQHEQRHKENQEIGPIISERGEVVEENR